MQEVQCDTPGTEVTVDESTPLGFSAADLLQHWNQSSVLALQWNIEGDALGQAFLTILEVGAPAELRRGPPVEYVEERLGDDESCSFERYVRVPATIELAAPEASLRVSLPMFFIAESPDPEQWLIRSWGPVPDAAIGADLERTFIAEARDTLRQPDVRLERVRVMLHENTTTLGDGRRGLEVSVMLTGADGVEESYLSAGWSRVKP